MDFQFTGSATTNHTSRRYWRPLLYVVWGNAPSEIFQFLVNKYQSLFPDHEFNRNLMAETLGLANAPPAVIQNLLNVRQELYPQQELDWNRVHGELAAPTGPDGSVHFLSSDTFCFLAKCSIASRVKAIGTRHLRDFMAMELLTFWPERHPDQRASIRLWLDEVQTRLSQFESEYLEMKEATSLLELALGKAKMIESSPDKVEGGRNNKKLKMDASDFRMKCHISCGADHLIENVLP